MTYCVALKLDEGLVCLSDTRTNAGLDNISMYRKMHTWCVPGERIIVMMTAGNLAVTQAVISSVQEALDHPKEGIERLLHGGDHRLRHGQVARRHHHDDPLSRNAPGVHLPVHADVVEPGVGARV